MVSLVKHEGELAIPPRFLYKAYEEALSTCGFMGGSDTQYPDFFIICEEVITLIVEERTKICENEIDRELKELRHRELLDVEYGFQPSTFGIQSEPEVFNALLLGGYAFVYNGEIFNASIKGVW